MGYFTIVFEGDIRDFDRNPMKIESAFGKPVASSIGDVFDDMAKLEEEIDRLAGNCPYRNPDCPKCNPKQVDLQACAVSDFPAGHPDACHDCDPCLAAGRSKDRDA